MITFDRYERPSDPETAYALYQEPRSILAAGMLWERITGGSYDTLIDLSGCGLDRIEETEDRFRFGAMVPLRDMETSDAFNRYTCGAAADALGHIVGVQFRNLATVGGSICGRFGFSDVSTLLLAFDAYAELFKGGTVPLAEYLAAAPDRDILLAVTIRKEKLRAVYECVRNTATDFPVLAMCMTRRADGDGAPLFRLSVGARPSRAAVTEFTAEEMLPDAGAAAGILTGRFRYGTNARGSAEYRAHLAKVLFQRAVAALEEET